MWFSREQPRNDAFGRFGTINIDQIDNDNDDELLEGTFKQNDRLLLLYENNPRREQVHHRWCRYFEVLTSQKCN